MHISMSYGVAQLKLSADGTVLLTIMTLQALPPFRLMVAMSLPLLSLGSVCVAVSVMPNSYTQVPRLFRKTGSNRPFSLRSEGGKALPPLFSRGGLGWGLLLGL